VFITRHHDGFSNWDTKYSDWKITNSPYGKDVLKMLSEECRKQGIRLGLYYSLLDWYRTDYPRETGRTGKGTGRTGKSDYASYLQFMKNQLTELTERTTHMRQYNTTNSVTLGLITLIIINLFYICKKEQTLTF
jgi:alpha-L-fucosidase